MSRDPRPTDPLGMGGLPVVERAGGARSRWRRWALPLLATLVLLALAWLAGPTSGSALGDPRSTGYGGLRGLLDVASSLGRQVDISLELPGDGTTTYLVLVDDLTPPERDVIRAWTEAGGRLVVADPSSPLADVEPVGSLLTDVFGATRFTAACDLLPDVGLVRSTRWVALEIPAGGEACFLLDDEGAWLVSRGSGEGLVIALGGPGPLANDHLDSDDNALAGVALLAPDADDRLLVRPLPEPGAGHAGLEDLVPTRVRHLVVALAGVYLVLVWWRGRRHGDPVDEPLPLRVPGAAIVEGVGGLLQRAGDRDGVARTLQDDLRTGVAARLGVARAGLDDLALAALAEERLGMDGAALLAALRTRAVDDDELLALGRAVAGLRASAETLAAAPRLRAPGDDDGAHA